MTAPLLGNLLEVQPLRVTRGLIQRTTQGHFQGIVIHSRIPEVSQDQVPEVAQDHLLNIIPSLSQGTDLKMIQGRYHVNGQGHPTDVIHGHVQGVQLDHITRLGTVVVTLITEEGCLLIEGQAAETEVIIIKKDINDMHLITIVKQDPLDITPADFEDMEDFLVEEVVVL